MEDTAVEDAMAIAKAYREATEADTMDLLNAQAKNGAEGSRVLVTGHNLSYLNMKYYLISAQWLRKAWSHVLKPPSRISKSWVDLVGRIDNSSLVVESNSGSDGVAHHPHHLQQQSAGVPTNGGGGGEGLQGGSISLRKDLIHEQHFYLVGSQAWLLLSQKFGYTHVCSAVVRVHKTNDSKLAVDLFSDDSSFSIVSNGQESLIPIPASGRFPYERSLEFPSLAEASTDTMKNPQDDEDDGKGPETGVNQNLVLSIPKHGNRQQVSDDSDNDQDSSSNPINGMSEGGILLLPPSTTNSAFDEAHPPSVMDTASPDALYSPLGKARANAGTAAIDDDFGFGSSNLNTSGAGSDDYWAMDSDTIEPTPALRTITTISRYRYGSGLGNLGNTCFMNSTLQCLGHTQPLQKYFLSGEFRRDLNRINPLGTGGELAIAFATLMSEMWSQETTTTVAKSSSFHDQEHSTVTWSSSTGHVVYPRDFKYIVGKHAEQFMGYEQHDSQEFATYLLDALHEDTNRITKKPYIEKPEQEEGESDREAADKAWGLHLQRENSRVSENFMGQVKSRVQCCEPGCGRVSTTFDPFMYLSVPIPGSSERTLTVHYVPLDAAKRVQSLSISLPKTGTVHELAKRTRDQVIKLGIEQTLSVDDLSVVDVWQKEIYTWFNFTDEVERIRDNDDTYLFALRPKEEIVGMSKKDAADGDDELGMYNIKEAQPKRYQLDPATMTRLNSGDNWTNEYAKYLCNHLGFLNAFNPTKGTTDDRVKLFQRTTTFLEQCYNDTKDLDVTLSSREVNDDEVKELVSRCDASPLFENVKSMHDLAILEFCAAKMRAEILRLIRVKKNESPGGVKICIRMKSPGTMPTARSQYFCNPMILRVAPGLTVYGLRQELAQRLSRSLRGPGDSRITQRSSGQSTSESEASNLEVNRDSDASRIIQNTSGGFEDNTFGSPELLIMRQIPLSYERKNPSYTVKSYDNSNQLGSLEKSRGHRITDSSRNHTSMASPKDPEESQVVSHIVGDQGTVNLEWTTELIERAFDVQEYEAVDDPVADAEATSAPVTRARRASKNSTSVLDCIEKYCQMEQLEETEMWYCNRCKKHVRAWKQFFLYRTPPILIIHLKRFQYSATTHRRDKISLFIDFPLKGLDLSEHVMHWSEDEKPIYDCYAVSNHYGGLGGGHYTAHALNDDGVWCYYDDSRVSTDVELNSIISDAAYVLYYRRRDILIDEDFLLKLRTPETEGPAIIGDVPDSKVASTSSEISGSNAAVVDDDNMEVEDTCSHCTSVGSMEGVDVVEFEQYHDGLPGDEEDGLARQ
ncbi:hypothetical protein ACA910_011279 [Epithemia clementina (nom. ined.)]